MARTIGAATIERVSIIDDDQSAREGYEHAVEDLGLQAVPEVGPLLPTIRELVERLPNGAEAVLCDYRLRIRGGYSTFDGDAIVARCYQRHFPAVLCTRFVDADIDLIRGFSRFIPALLRPEELDPDTLWHGFERCIAEFQGDFAPSRKPWRTLVRVEEVESSGSATWIYVVLPGWNRRQVIRLLSEHLPPQIRKLAQPGRRFHAKVNVGADSHEQIYFDDWEDQ